MELCAYISPTGEGVEVRPLVKTENIRDVISFPKTASASCLMSEAPNLVAEHQLKELHIDLRK